MSARTEMLMGFTGLGLVIADLLFMPGISEVTWAFIDLIVS